MSLVDTSQLPNMKCTVWGEPTHVDKPYNCPDDDEQEMCVDWDGTIEVRCPHFAGLVPDKEEVQMGELVPARCRLTVVG